MNRRVALGLLAFASCAWAQAPGKGLVIILIGPPGAGKSTQAELISKKYKVASIDIDTFKLKQGESVDDAVAARVRQMDARTGFILDGYPRTRAQANKLTALLTELKLPNPIIVQIDVPEEVARARVSKQSGRDLKTFDAELAQYHQEMQFARQQYPEADIWTINGNRNSAREVFETVEMLLRDRQGVQ